MKKPPWLSPFFDNAWRPPTLERPVQSIKKGVSGGHNALSLLQFYAKILDYEQGTSISRDSQ
jgi:hypothetical protein